MKRKIIKFCALLLLGWLYWLSGDWFISQGRLFSIIMHCLYTMVLFYCIPLVIFKRGEYRLVSFVLEVLIGFVLFFWLYLNGTAEIRSLSDIAWAELLMFDCICIFAAGFGGALYYTTPSHNKQY